MAHDSTDGYVRRPSAAAAARHPPLPPKEFDLVKETQGAAELDSSERESLESDHRPHHHHYHQSPYYHHDDGDDDDHHHHHSHTHSHSHSHTNQAPYQPPSPPYQPRRKVRILSLDGGGIRGYSTLVILGELMHQIYVQEHGGRPPKSPADLPRPCDYFDLIGGNGMSPHCSGGLWRGLLLVWRWGRDCGPCAWICGSCMFAQEPAASSPSCSAACAWTSSRASRTTSR